MYSVPVAAVDTISSRRHPVGRGRPVPAARTEQCPPPASPDPIGGPGVEGVAMMLVERESGIDERVVHDRVGIDDPERTGLAGE